MSGGHTVVEFPQFAAALRYLGESLDTILRDVDFFLSGDADLTYSPDKVLFEALDFVHREAVEGPPNRKESESLIRIQGFIKEMKEKYKINE